MYGHSSLLPPPISEAKLRLRPSLDQARTWFQTALCAFASLSARAGSQSLRESRRAPRKKTCACIFLRCFFLHCFTCYSIWFSDCPSCGSPNVHPFSSPSVPPPMVWNGILFLECPSSSSPNVPYSAFTLVFSGFPECPQCTLWAPPGGSPGAFRGLFGSSWGHRSPKWHQDCFPMPL